MSFTRRPISSSLKRTLSWDELNTLSACKTFSDDVAKAEARGMRVNALKTNFICISDASSYRASGYIEGWLEFVRIGICQNSFLLKIGICQIWNLSELEFVRIGNCQNWNLSELEFVRIGICQNWNLLELKFVRISSYLISGQKCYIKLTWCFSLS